MTTGKVQIRLTRSSAAYWRITFDNPPLNVLGPQFVREFGEILAAIEADRDVKVVVLESAVEGFFLNHSDFLADMKELTSMPQGPTGLEAWPDPIAVAISSTGFSCRQRGSSGSWAKGSEHV